MLRAFFIAISPMLCYFSYILPPPLSGRQVRGRRSADLLTQVRSAQFRPATPHSLAYQCVYIYSKDTAVRRTNSHHTAGQNNNFLIFYVRLLRHTVLRDIQYLSFRPPHPVGQSRTSSCIEVQYFVQVNKLGQDNLKYLEISWVFQQSLTFLLNVFI